MRVLYVINQDTPLHALARRLRASPMADVTVLCSHHLFNHEQKKLLNVNGRIRIVRFHELLSDADCAECDGKMPPLTLPGTPPYPHMVREKNRLVHERLGSFDAIFASDGLGVDLRYWTDVGAKPISASFTTRLMSMIERIRFASRQRSTRDHLLITEDMAVLFYGPIGRLGLNAAYGLSVQSLNPATSLREARRISGARPLTLATTLHFATHPRAASPDTVVVSDGYHPPNYPRSYLSALVGRKFMPRDMFDAQWFRSHGFETLPPFPFLRREFMATPDPERQIRHVVLALNHAGDWTAAVNRSDTDLLVEAFIDLARQFPGWQFRVRPHPTMTHPSHEGVASLRRLRRVVERNGSNLAFSLAPLESDLEQGDLFVSEYSNVLLEAWKRGRLGFSVNLSNRRNFMEPYTSLGFGHATRIGEAMDLLVAADTGELARSQSQSVRRFNQELARYLVLAEPPGLKNP